MKQDVSKAVVEDVERGKVYLVAIIGEDSLVFRSEGGDESVTILDDAVGAVMKRDWDAAGPEGRVVVFIGGRPAPVQLIVQKQRLKKVDLAAVRV